jgi:hypothetical protein
MLETDVPKWHHLLCGRCLQFLLWQRVVLSRLLGLHDNVFLRVQLLLPSEAG